ncbi:MAG: hypothetical protein ACE5E9_07245 [Nitrospinaceae bacterium]
MQIQCGVCEQHINIPDEKLPRGRACSIVCPACRAKVRVEAHLKTPPPEETPREPGAPPPAPREKMEESSVDISRFVLRTDFEDEDEDLLLYGDNDRIALVLDDTNRDPWTEALEELGYKIQMARSPEHAVHKMRFTHFHLVALNENFGGIPLSENPVYKSLVEMNMSTRRNIFFAVVGANFKTLNNMDAFTHSVNVVINPKDMDKLPRILKKSITENDAFYKVFKESLHAMGKS